MSAFSGHNLATARSTTVARQRRLQHVLEQYGVLTHDSLCELAGASHWSVPFDVVLHNAIRAGRVRRLSDDLFEAGPSEPPRR
jgi:hypothetical protein